MYYIFEANLQISPKYLCKIQIIRVPGKFSDFWKEDIKLRRDPGFTATLNAECKVFQLRTFLFLENKER